MLPSFLRNRTGAAPSRSRTERRGAKRLAPGHPTPCLLQAAGAPRPSPAWVHNLSVKGVGLLTRQEFPAGTKVQILLVNAAHVYALSVDMTVIRCFRIVSGDFFLGARFDRVLQPEELMPFMV
jgi:hypothetical protein